jgi:hypothetical protein
VNASSHAGDPVEDALAAALDEWSRARDRRQLRRALLALMAELE